jgi:hypothetical protein
MATLSDVPAYSCHLELRRLYRQAPWAMAGVIVDGAWHPLDAGIDRPDVRAIQARLVLTEPLPSVIAPDGQRAVELARWVAMGSGRPLWQGNGRAATRRVTFEAPMPDRRPW